MCPTSVSTFTLPQSGILWSRTEASWLWLDSPSAEAPAGGSCRRAVLMDSNVKRGRRMLGLETE